MTTVRSEAGLSHDTLTLGASKGAHVLARCGHYVTVAVVLPGEPPACGICQRLLSK